MLRCHTVKHSDLIKKIVENGYYYKVLKNGLVTEKWWLFTFDFQTLEGAGGSMPKVNDFSGGRVSRSKYTWFY